MEAGGLLAVAIAASALGAAAMAHAAMDFARDRARHKDVQRQAGAGGFVRPLLQAGVPALARVARVALGVRVVREPIARMSAVVRMRGFDCTDESLATLLLAVCGGVFLAACALGSWVAGLAFSVCTFAVGSAWAGHAFDQRRDDIREALPDAVRAMSACFHAGYTLQQTFGQLQRELKGPVGDLFGSARDAMETGATAKEALASLRGSSIVPELSFVSVALEVQHRAGGSMRHVLDAACESLEGELDLRRSLRVHTAQARLSARVVTGVTVGMVGVLSLLTEDFLAPFFASGLGMAMLACAVAMQVAGVATIRKMLRVEVD